MPNITHSNAPVVAKEGDVFNKTVVFILVFSAAIFVMPALAIILVADAFAIGGGSSIAINMTIGAAILALMMPFVFAISRRIGGPTARTQMIVLQRDVALLQQELLELRHQTLMVTESAEFSKQLLMSKEKTTTEKSSQTSS